MMQEYNCLTANATEYTDLLHIESLRLSMAVVWVAVGLVMFIGNLLVVGSIALHRTMRTVTNCYILNLAITDLLVSVIVLPLKGVQLLGPCWLSALLFNSLGCAVVTFFLMLLVFTSLLTLVVISLERFMAIVHPLRSLLFQSRSRTGLFILLTWCLPCVFCLVQAFHPAAVPFHGSSRYGSLRNQHCLDSFSQAGRTAYVMSSFALLFLCPLAVVIFTSGAIIRALMRPAPGEESGVGGSGGGACAVQPSGTQAREENKRKVAKMIIVVACLYLVSWAPWYTVNLAGLFYTDLFDENFTFLMALLHLVGFVNSTSNPIVYYFMSQRFRDCYHRLLAGLCCRRLEPPANPSVAGVAAAGSMVSGNGARVRPPPPRAESVAMRPLLSGSTAACGGRGREVE